MGHACAARSFPPATWARVARSASLAVGSACASRSPRWQGCGEERTRSRREEPGIGCIAARVWHDEQQRLAPALRHRPHRSGGAGRRLSVDDWRVGRDVRARLQRQLLTHKRRLTAHRPCVLVHEHVADAAIAVTELAHICRASEDEVDAIGLAFAVAAPACIDPEEAVPASLRRLADRGRDRRGLEAVERGLEALLVAQGGAVLNEGKDLIGRRSHQARGAEPCVAGRDDLAGSPDQDVRVPDRRHAVIRHGLGLDGGSSLRQEP